MGLTWNAERVDWIAVSLRWLLLLVVAVVLGAMGGMHLYNVLTLGVAAAWNGFLTITASLSRRIPDHPYLSVAFDLGFAYLLFFTNGGLQGEVDWIGLLPLVSAALYFKVRGAVIASMLSVLYQGIVALFNAGPLEVLLLVVVLLPLYFSPGVAIGYLVRWMEEKSAPPKEEQVAAQRETERMEREWQRERERQHQIYQLVSALSSSLNYQRVLETALDMSASALGTPSEPEERLVSAVLLYSEDDADQPALRVGTARRFTSTDHRISLPGVSGLLGRTIDEGDAQLSQDLLNDPELRRIVAFRACQAAYCLPLRSGLDTYGVLLFGHPEADYFTAQRREILDIIGNQAMIAIQNARLYHDLEEEKERMMEIQEEARKKLARDLHDGPTQSVSALAMRVNYARRLMERDEKAAADELYKIEDLARRTTKEIRHMLFTLRPLVLESQGLNAAFESMAEKMRETYNQEVIIAVDLAIVPMLELSKQGVIFYIAEEAVNNARKHARAAHIWVRLKPWEKDVAMLEVEDDGVGFRVDAVNSDYENRGSLGLVNMRERTELVNGILQIDSQEGRGTRVRVWIPLSEEAADRLRRGP